MQLLRITLIGGNCAVYANANKMFATNELRGAPISNTINKLLGIFVVEFGQEKAANETLNAVKQ